eukprot:scaffold35107_cov28-Tisochrysis_lutea.AAC.2
MDDWGTPKSLAATVGAPARLRRAGGEGGCSTISSPSPDSTDSVRITVKLGCDGEVTGGEGGGEGGAGRQLTLLQLLLDTSTSLSGSEALDSSKPFRRGSTEYGHEATRRVTQWRLFILAPRVMTIVAALIPRTRCRNYRRQLGEGAMVHLWCRLAITSAGSNRLQPFVKLLLAQIRHRILLHRNSFGSQEAPRAANKPGRRVHPRGTIKALTALIVDILRPYSGRSRSVEIARRRRLLTQHAVISHNVYCIEGRLQLLSGYTSSLLAFPARLASAIQHPPDGDQPREVRCHNEDGGAGIALHIKRNEKVEDISACEGIECDRVDVGEESVDGGREAKRRKVSEVRAFAVQEAGVLSCQTTACITICVGSLVPEAAREPDRAIRPGEAKRAFAGAIKHARALTTCCVAVVK